MHLPSLAVFNTVKLDRIGNVGAGEDTLLQLWVPPSILRNDGDCLFIHATVALAANANAKISRFYVATTTIQGRSGTDNNSIHDMRAYCYRRGPTSLWTIALLANLTTATQIVEQNDITIDLENPIEIKITGEGVEDGDLTSRVLRYAYIPANSNFDF